MIYFDYAASNPIDPRVAEAFFSASTLTGNPSSIHAAGRELRRLVDAARGAVARLISVDPAEVVFTSGATESNNAAIFGLCRPLARRYPGRQLRILTSPFEHSSVRAAVETLASETGWAVDRLPVGEGGVVDPAEAARRITKDTVLVCLMWVNNILGTIQPIVEVGRAIDAARAERQPSDPPLLYFCDAVQAAARLPVSPSAAGLDVLSISAHKLGGTKGIGALYLRRGPEFSAVAVGGGQESSRRSGTENAGGIVAFGRAAEFAAEEIMSGRSRIISLRRHLDTRLASLPAGWAPLGRPDRSVPDILFLQHRRLKGDDLALRLDAAGIAASSGSACDAGKRSVSPALMAVQGEAAARRGGIRISFGRFTTEGDIDALAAVLRGLSGS